MTDAPGLPNTPGGSRGDRMLLGRMTAGVDLLTRSGISEFELAYDDEANVPGGVLWWAGGNWSGTRKFSEHFPYPAQAVEDLLSRVLNGGMCKRCGRTTVIGVLLEGDYCCFTLTATDVDDEHSYAYVRTCEAAEP